MKLKVQDVKYRSTDVVDIEGMFRIIESIPSPNAEPMKLWLARFGKERIDEVFDPLITVQRAIDTYHAKVACDDIENNLGETVVTKDNALSYKYVEEDLMIKNKE